MAEGAVLSDFGAMFYNTFAYNYGVGGSAMLRCIFSAH
jgi:hypothetical protein